MNEGQTKVVFWKTSFCFPYENVLSVLFREECSIVPRIFLFELCFWFSLLPLETCRGILQTAIITDLFFSN